MKEMWHEKGRRKKSGKKSDNTKGKKSGMKRDDTKGKKSDDKIGMKRDDTNRPLAGYGLPPPQGEFCTPYFS